MNFYIIELVLLLSVVVGGVLVSTLNATNKNQYIKLALAFSGGFLLAVIFQHLLPELYGAHNGPAYDHNLALPVLEVGVYILLGFLVQLVLEYFSGGIEHGHVHVHQGQAMPWTLFISLSVHSVIEGIPLGNMLQLGLDNQTIPYNASFFWGIVFHQIPVAIALMTLLLATRLNRRQAWLILLTFGLMTPIGVFLGLGITTEQLGLNVNVILAIVVGMFLHISTTIIFETAENHKFNLLKLLSILVGVGLATGIF
ncbi:MAG: ZIP family metal transporter [Sphingomonadales bacterium]|nr:ZIP family metal transporter [Sphingomonadales bacterium]